MALLRSRAARSSALSVHPMFPSEWTIPSCLRPALSLADSQSVRCLPFELSSGAVCYSIRPGWWAKQSRDPERLFSRWLCASRSVSFHRGLGGGVAVLEPAGLGLLLGGEGVSLYISRRLSLSLSTGRRCWWWQQARAIFQEGRREGRERKREAKLAARDIFSLTSDPPSFNHDRKIIQMKEPLKLQMLPLVARH